MLIVYLLVDGVYAALREASNRWFYVQSELMRIQNRISQGFVLATVFIHVL